MQVYWGNKWAQQQQQQWWDRKPEALMHPSILELCFHRHNPNVQAQTYLEVFHQMLGEGLIDRYKSLHVLKYWQTLSLLAGSDIDCGISPVIAKALNITPAELDLPFQQAEEAANSIQALTEQLQQSRIFQEQDDGQTPFFSFQMQTGREGGQEEGNVDGVFTCATNASFGKTFRPALALVDDVVTHQSAPGLLPDRALFFRTIITGLYCRDTCRGRSEFVKIFNAEGNIRLYIIQARPFEWPDDQLGAFFRLEEASPSRHLSHRPHYQKVAHAFRQPQEGSKERGPQGKQALTSSAEPFSALPSPSSLLSVFPGLASFPLSTLPPFVGCSGDTPSFLPPQVSIQNLGEQEEEGEEEEEEEEEEADFVQGVQLKGNKKGEGRWEGMEEDGSQVWGMSESSFFISPSCLSLPDQYQYHQQQQHQEEEEGEGEKEKEEVVHQQHKVQRQQQYVQDQQQLFEHHHQQQQQRQQRHTNAKHNFNFHPSPRASTTQSSPYPPSSSSTNGTTSSSSSVSSSAPSSPFFSSSSSSSSCSSSRYPSAAPPLLEAVQEVTFSLPPLADLEGGMQGERERGGEKKGVGESMREDWSLEQEERRRRGGGKGALLSDVVLGSVPCLDEETLRDVFFGE